ncbi:hypothetical protein DYH09_03885, partial [bacterium CPR1]|nr:hypothetical protein [bacterium CPR1]
YWGGTGDLGGPIGLAVAGGVTGAVLIGGLGSFLADRSYENKLDAYYLQMDGFRGAEQRYQSDKREYDRELKAWAQRKEEKHPASVLEDADRLLVNGVQLKKKSPQKPPPPSQGPTLQRPG